MNTNYRGLAFLLSIGSIPIACNDKDTETETGSTTAGSGTSGTTGTGDDATDPTTGNSMSSTPTTGDSGDSGTGGTGGTGGTTDASTSGSTGPVDPSDTEPQATTFLTSDTDTDTDADTGFDTDEPPPPTDPTCIGYAEHFVECAPQYARYQDQIAQACEYYKGYALRNDGQACQDAFDAYYVCVSKVDCAELMQEQPPESCQTEFMAVFEACPSLSEPGQTTTDSEGGSGSSSG